jgi:hypothetical protein
VNVLVHEIAVLVAASEVIVATCATFGLQAARVSKGMTRISLILILSKSPLMISNIISSCRGRKARVGLTTTIQLNRQDWSMKFSKKVIKL